MQNTPKQKPKSALKQCNVGLPLERIGIDIIGPMTPSMCGNKYIITICDYFTKFLVAVLIENQEVKTVAKCFVEKICFSIWNSVAIAL